MSSRIKSACFVNPLADFLFITTPYHNDYLIENIILFYTNPRKNINEIWWSALYAEKHSEIISLDLLKRNHISQQPVTLALVHFVILSYEFTYLRIFSHNIPWQLVSTRSRVVGS